MNPNSLSSCIWKTVVVMSVGASVFSGMNFVFKPFLSFILNTTSGKILSIILSLTITVFLAFLAGSIKWLVQNQRHAENLKNVRETVMDEIRGLGGSLENLINELDIEIRTLESCFKKRKKYNPNGWKYLASICGMIRKANDLSMKETAQDTIRLIVKAPEFESLKLLRETTLRGVANIHRILNSPTKTPKLLWEVRALAVDIKEVHLEELKSFAVKM